MNARTLCATDLRVEFAGEEYAASREHGLTFGRRSGIIIDDNRFLHRLLGTFSFDGGLWWLTNVGSAIAITIVDETSASLARLAPGASMPITFDSCSVRFEAGGRAYELLVDIVGEPQRDSDDYGEMLAQHAATDAEETATTASLPLTDDQFALLRAIAAPLLRGHDEMPTNRHLASGLGWTITKWNRKLDGLCIKYSNAGVAGLHGSSDQLAKDRRSRLAEHVVDAGIVRREHLDC